VSRYRQIADELRRRIETGELAPGDRVPSTREIIRQWGVAMATATKVLTELRNEGLVRAVSGVGTVVTGPRPAARSGPASAGTSRTSPADAGHPTTRASTAGADIVLTSGRIVGVAIAVADAEGLGAVSMRRVAAELGVATMSLYRHVADKDHLLLQMMDVGLAGLEFPADPPDSWRERIELAARMLWAMFRRHPWLAPALSVTRPQVVPSAIPFTEWVLTALDGRGLDMQTMFTANVTLFNYIRGTAVNVELETEAEAASGLDNDEWIATQEPALHALFSGGRFPLFERLVTAGYDFELDALFEFGLRRLLDGIAALIDDAPRPSR
jgi:AcrR family transcriptional regulator